jgi:ZIP family zinc transporter
VVVQLEVVAWGLLAASSLGLGALLGMFRPWPERLVGLVLGFGAGALVSAISFELAGEGLREAGLGPVAVGMAAGALAFYALAGASDRFSERRALSDAVAGGTGIALALGAILDGIPEMLVLGIQLSYGQGLSLPLILAIFVSNLPEAMASAAELHKQGVDRLRIAGLWGTITVGLAAVTPIGAAVADRLGPGATAAFNGFAAGALLVMLIDAMAPEARGKADRVSGLATTLGFTASVALNSIS